MKAIDRDFWAGRHVFVTGHMGFKGTWLCRVLESLGSKSTGYGYDKRNPLLYRDIPHADHDHIEGDVSDLAALTGALQKSESDVVFHLAAQPLVLASYEDPIRTYRDNILGVANLLQAVRGLKKVKAVVIVTSDKVYENKEWIWPYREDDPLGGKDPYSASKGAAEIVAQSMIRSFFQVPGEANVATARAGNVIGGGDWADDRLLVDAAKALGKGDPLIVRNPHSTRPWQHVLEPLSGYMILAQELAGSGANKLDTAYNFGPSNDGIRTVGDVAETFTSSWGGTARWAHRATEDGPKEAGFLSIDSSRAHQQLGWEPRWAFKEAVERTAQWYSRFSAGDNAADLMDRDISAYFSGEGLVS